MNKIKRILALAGVIIIVGLYLVTIIFALSDHPDASDWLFRSIAATVVIPTLLYIYMWFLKLTNNRKDDEDQR